MVVPDGVPVTGPVTGMVAGWLVETVIVHCPGCRLAQGSLDARVVVDHAVGHASADIVLAQVNDRQIVQLVVFGQRSIDQVAHQTISGSWRCHSSLYWAGGT